MFLYVITNKVNGKQYVGQTNNPKRRWAYHRSIHKIAKSVLAAAMRKYGINNFSFRIAFDCIPQSQIDHEEKYLIYVLDTYNNGYNATMGGEGSMGCKATEERKLKISLSKIGKPRSPETIEKMRLAAIGRKQSRETRDKKSKSLIGRAVTPRMIEALRSRKGKKLTEGQKEHLRKINLGKKLTEETKRKIALKNTGKNRSVETRIKMSEKAKQREARKRIKRQCEQKESNQLYLTYPK